MGKYSILDPLGPIDISKGIRSWPATLATPTQTLLRSRLRILHNKLTIILGSIMNNKQVTDPNNNVDTTVNKLEADLTYLEKLDINKETRSYNKEKRE